jgi:hypothetical protein
MTRDEGQDDILCPMRYFMLGVIVFLLAPGAGAVEEVVSERLDLLQRQSVITDHERLVGNVRAQARREGVVVQLPQLYVYLYDHSASWHLDGFRRGFERELNLTVMRQRRARSMVRLDRLLERVTDPAGEEVRIADLPDGDVYILLYRRANCAECDQVEQAVGQWLAEVPELSAVWIDVWMDRRPEG